MADNDDTGESGGDTGGFVFGDEQTTDDERGATIAGFAVGNVVAAVLLVVAVVMLVYVAQLLVTGAVTDLLADSEDGNAVPNATPTGTTATATTASETQSTSTVETDNATDGAATQRAGAPSASPTARTPTPSPTATPTATATPEPTATRADEGGGAGSNASTETATSDERSPAIDSFIVTDRSAGGAALFDVAWNVSDPDRDLVAVQVSLVADPDGEARTVAQREFDAGGARTTGSTTFEVPDGGGTVYEVRIEVVDGSGNTAFSLTRTVADGSPDE